MKVVDSKKIQPVIFTGGKSKRLVIKSHNMGFGICETHVKKGGPYHWHYKNHLEACYCVSGIGFLTNLSNDMCYKITEGITYILDKNDDHLFEAITDVVLISVFNPPLNGNETHDSEGNYIINN
jgi:L-ectoine synthase